MTFHIQDDIFLSNVTKLAMSHLDQEDYSSSSMAEELSVSRFQLHRKLKSILGLSFSQFIMLLRIWKSIFLLKKNKGNVSEVAYMVGFSSPSYFIKCYTKVFGISPGETRKTGKFPKKPGFKFHKVIDNPNVRAILAQNDFEFDNTNQKKGVFNNKGSLVFAITGLVIFITLLINSNNISETKSITYYDEYGILQKRTIVKPEFRKRVTVFTFRNKGPNDNEVDWLGTGLCVGLSEDLGQNAYLISQRKNAKSLAEMVEKSRSEKQDFFLTGFFLYDSSGYKVDFYVYELVKTKPIYKFSLEGSDLFEIIDSASVTILPKLGLSGDQISYSMDLPVSEYMTSNLDAFRKYSESYLKPRLDFDFYPWDMEEATIIDSTFALAGYHSADFLNHWLINDAILRDCFKVAMSSRERLNEGYKLQILALYYQINKQPENAIKLLELQSNFVEPTAYNLKRLANLYMINYQFEKALEIQMRLVQEFTAIRYECDLVYFLILAEKLEEAEKTANLLLIKYPGNLDVMELYMRLMLNMGKSEEAKKMRDKIMLLDPESAVVLSLLDSLFMRPAEQEFSNLNDFTGTYQIPESGMKAQIKILNGQLRFAYENQPGSFHYQYKPDHFITSVYRDQTHKKVFMRDENGKVYKIINHEYLKDSNFYKYDIWKIDSLIIKGFEYFNNSQNLEARDQFRMAVQANPKHKYLNSYLRHLEFITGSDFDSEIYERYVGRWVLISHKKQQVPEDYKDRPVKRFAIVNNDIIYYPACCTTEYKIMPISSTEARFHRYDWSDDVIFRMISRNDSLMLKIITFNHDIKEYEEQGTFLKAIE